MKLRAYLQEGVYDPSIFKAIFLAGGPGCFSPETIVWTDDGMKRIDDLKIGDMIKTLDENNNVVILPLTDILKNDIYGILEITLENDEKILCSTDHKFRLKNGDWKEAIDLNENDDLWVEK